VLRAQGAPRRPFFAPASMSAPDALLAALADRYRFVRELGAGGMATVYLADDLRHGRPVAVKVVRREVASSAGGDRFLREIGIAARLQHPHIVPVLDSGATDGALYYMMPFVAGETLRQRLDREGSLSDTETVRLLLQVVDALAYAHGQGVVHRDVKADNVMLAGRHALVMDFGVARAVREAAAPGTGATVAMTQVGMTMGTPAYMAPEQAVADPAADHRVDLYSVGVLAYEMLAGRLPFPETSLQALLAAHLTQAPEPLGRLVPGMSSALEAVVMRCLAKRPGDRWQGADALLAALEPLASTGSGGVRAERPTRARGRGLRGPWLGGTLAAAAATAGAWFASRPAPPEALRLGRSAQFTSQAGLEIHPALSPDGRLVAFAAGTPAALRILVRPAAGGRMVAVTDDSASIEYLPSWSPDGQWLAFAHNDAVAVAPVLGGELRTVVPPAPGRPVTSVTWAPDGQRLAFSRKDSLFTVSREGGPATLVGRAPEIHSCQWSPAGRWIACADGNAEGQMPGQGFGNRAPAGIVVFPARGGAPVTVVPNREGNLGPTWSADGGTLYFLSDRDGPRDLYGVRLSDDGTAAGPPARLTTGLNALSVSLSQAGGRLVYNVYSARANLWRLPIPATGVVDGSRAKALTTGSQVIESMSVSRDGTWLVYDSNVHGNSDIFRMPAAGGPSERLTSEPWDEFAPSLSPDNALVAYHSFRNGTRDLELKPVGAPGQVVRVTDTREAQESYPRWSPDGRRLAFVDQGMELRVLALARRPDGGFGAPTLLGRGQVPDWSADSRTLYFSAFPPGAPAQWTAETDAVLAVPMDGMAPRRIPLPPGLRRSQQLCVRADGRALYIKVFDAAGHASIASVPVGGGAPRVLVTFRDPTRPSTRGDFACSARHFYFTLDEQESDLFVAEAVFGR
jgi:Tol biopolymer transport system component